MNTESKKLSIVLKDQSYRQISSLVFNKILQAMANLVSRNTALNPNLILCGAMNGRWYGDNSRYLFEWLLMQRPDLCPVWMTLSRDVFNTLSRENKPVVLIRSLTGIKCLMHARIGIFTNSLLDLAITPYMIPDRLRLIALRHGRSVKRVRFARKAHPISEKEATERRREGELIEYAASTSEFVSDIQEECLQIGRHRHVVTGYPRNDQLLAPCYEDSRNWQLFIDGRKPQLVALYAPSWRHGRESTRFFPFSDFDEVALAAFLNTHDILLLLRPHVNDLRNYPELNLFLNKLARISANIRMATHVEFSDVNSFLPFVDLLISDYSALYHDYLLLNRPMLFIPYDYEEFNVQNGFLYNYKEMLPGPAITSFIEFRKEINRLLRGEDRFVEKRRMLCDMIHANIDGGSSKRVAALIDSLLAGVSP